MWVRVDRPRKNPVRVEVTEGSEIYDVIEAAISEEKLDISPADVTVKFNGEAVDGDAVVSEFSTSCKNPLLLELAEQEGKLYAVTYVVLQVFILVTCTVCTIFTPYYET